MKTILVLTAFILSMNINGQERYYTKTGHINFFSHAPLEDITANNNQVAAFLETENGQLTFAVLMKSFEFKKALMQEHFNENYVESDEFPKAKFKGSITNFNSVDLKVGGEFPVNVQGTLTIHGVSKEIEADGSLKIEDGLINAISTFQVRPEDYDIKIPAAVKKNIAEIIDINIKVKLEPYVR